MINKGRNREGGRRKKERECWVRTVDGDALVVLPQDFRLISVAIIKTTNTNRPPQDLGNANDTHNDNAATRENTKQENR